MDHPSPSQTHLNSTMIMFHRQAEAMVRKLISYIRIGCPNIHQLKGVNMLSGTVHIWGQICQVKPSVDMLILFLLETNIRYCVVHSTSVFACLPK